MGIAYKVKLNTLMKIRLGLTSSTGTLLTPGFFPNVGTSKQPFFSWNQITDRSGSLSTKIN